MTEVTKDRVDGEGSSSNVGLDTSPRSSLIDKKDETIEEGGSRDTASNQETEIDWKLLPPLPAPEEAKHKEFRCGSCILGGVAAMCFVAIQSAFGLLNHAQANGTASFFVITVSVLFLIEILCLTTMYYKDPGVVKRSPYTCHPIPPQVQPYARSYMQRHQQNQLNVENNELVQETVPMPSELYISMDDENTQDGQEIVDTYCVRCLVWRRGRKKYFHCNTCQRCVAHYDHHCNVFGRCIAGHLPFQGNIPLFYLTIGASGLLYGTTAIGLAWTLLGMGGMEIAI